MDVSGEARRLLTKNRSRGITPSIIPGPLFSILSHAAASRQREGGALFDVPAQMQNDSDTKRGPTTQVLTGQFSIGERLDLTLFFLKGRNQITAALLTPLCQVLVFAISLAVTTLIPLKMT